MFFLLNPSLSNNASSSENNELEQVSSTKDKPQEYKWHSTACFRFHDRVNISYFGSGENPTISSDILLLIIHYDLDQSIVLWKGKRICTNDLLYNFVLYSYFITFSFFYLISWFSLYSQVHVRGLIRLKLEVYYARENDCSRAKWQVEFGTSTKWVEGN